MAWQQYNGITIAKLVRRILHHFDLRSEAQDKTILLARDKLGIPTHHHAVSGGLAYRPPLRSQGWSKSPNAGVRKASSAAFPKPVFPIKMIDVSGQTYGSLVIYYPNRQRRAAGAAPVLYVFIGDHR